MKRHQKEKFSFADDISNMMNTFDHVGLAGRKMHIWKRQRFPDMEAFHDFSYNAWEAFKSYLETNFELIKLDLFAGF